MGDQQIGAVHAAPDDECVIGAVPEAAEQHGQHEIDRALRLAALVAAERDVDVIAQEARQGHVPAPPEFDDGERGIGRVEVGRQAHAKQAREPDRHVAIAGKIEIELDAVTERALPCEREANLADARGREGRLDEGRDIVGDDDLLDEADGEQRESNGVIGPARIVFQMRRRRQPAKLRHDLGMVHDRTGDQLREKEDEQSEV